MALQARGDEQGGEKIRKDGGMEDGGGRKADDGRRRGEETGEVRMGIERIVKY